MSPCRRQFFFVFNNYLFSLFSHFWLAIPQLVLQADWQEVWHSPQPPFFALSQRLRVSTVLICFIEVFLHRFSMFIISYDKLLVNSFSHKIVAIYKPFADFGFSFFFNYKSVFMIAFYCPIVFPIDD